ncbi:Endonuclease/exonuclease/phosphatase, partial [Lenzites betulinus]
MVVTYRNNATSAVNNNTSLHTTVDLQNTGNRRLGGAGGVDAPHAEIRSNDRPAENGGSALLENNRQQGAGAGREDRGNQSRNGTRARLTLASLNMNGFATTSGPGEVQSKWMLINQLMRDEKICILALQETHLTQERVASLHNLFGQYLNICSEPWSDGGTRAGGVCFVINKRRVNCDDYTVEQLVPGRAALLRIPWTNGRSLSILNVYAPNDAGENSNFWKELNAHQTCRPDAMLGDFNVVDDPIDRLPTRSDPCSTVESLGDLCRSLRLRDGWRETNANVRAYTYMHGATGSQSRLDRIYATASLIKDASVWTIAESGVPTDHKLVMVSLANRAVPFRGKGRWSMPLHIIEDGPMKVTLMELAAAFVAELESIRVRSDSVNPQSAYAAFKKSLIEATRNRAKEKIPAMKRRLDRLRLNLSAILNPPDKNEISAEDRMHAAIIQDRITRLEEKAFAAKRRRVEEVHWESDEKITKKWI